jgi:hypothetical protein
LLDEDDGFEGQMPDAFIHFVIHLLAQRVPGAAYNH